MGLKNVKSSLPQISRELEKTNSSREFLIKNNEFESYTNKWKQRIIDYYKTHEILGRE